MKNVNTDKVHPSQKLVDHYVVQFSQHEPYGYEAYQKMHETMFAVEAEPKQNFEFTSKAYILNDLIVATTQANTHWATFKRSHQEQATIGSDYLLVFFYEDVSFEVQTPNADITVAPEQIVFADLANPITIKAARINVVSLNFSRHLLAKFMPIADHFHGAILPESPHQQLLLAYMKTLAKVAGEIKVSDCAQVAEQVVSMVANGLKQLNHRKHHKLPSLPNVTFFQLKQAIDADIEDTKLSAETLMTKFGISRSTVYRMFASLGGVGRYIKDRKLDYAFNVLAHSNPQVEVSIAALANKLGYKNPSAFTRAFQQRFELSPSEVRAGLRKSGEHYLPWDADMDFTPFKNVE